MKKILLLCSMIVMYCFSVKAQTLTASPTTVDSDGEVTFTAQNESVIGHITIFNSAGVSPTSQITIAPVSGSDTYWNTFSQNIGSKFKCKFTNQTTSNITVNVTISATVNNDNTGTQNTSWSTVIAITVKGKVTTPTTYYNDAKSAIFYNNTCATGYGSDPYTYIVPANRYSSTISKADANNKAQTDINNNGQTIANQNTTCKLLYYNTAVSQNFTPACSVGYQAPNSSVNYLVPAGKYKSTVSQANADAQAQTDINANGQTFANNTCKLVYKSTAITGNFQKNDCGTGYAGSMVSYTVPAAQFTSLVSQADANNQAQTYLSANGQIYANANGSCTKINTITFNVLTTYSSPTYFMIFVDGMNISGSRVTAAQNVINPVSNNGVPANSNSTVVMQVTSGHVPTSAYIQCFWGRINGVISGNNITFTGANLSVTQTADCVIN